MKKLKLLYGILFCLFLSVAVPTIDVIASENSSTSVISSDTDILHGVLYLVGGSGVSVGICILYHKHNTTGLMVDISDLDWERDNVVVSNTTYVRTYTTVEKNAYAEKR